MRTCFLIIILTLCVYNTGYSQDIPWPENTPPWKTPSFDENTAKEWAKTHLDNLTKGKNQNEIHDILISVIKTWENWYSDSETFKSFIKLDRKEIVFKVYYYKEIFNISFGLLYQIDNQSAESIKYLNNDIEVIGKCLDRRKSSDVQRYLLKDIRIIYIKLKLLGLTSKGAKISYFINILFNGSSIQQEELGISDIMLNEDMTWMRELHESIINELENMSGLKMERVNKICEILSYNHKYLDIERLTKLMNKTENDSVRGMCISCLANTNNPDKILPEIIKYYNSNPQQIYQSLMIYKPKDIFKFCYQIPIVKNVKEMMQNSQNTYSLIINSKKFMEMSDKSKISENRLMFHLIYYENKPEVIFYLDDPDPFSNSSTIVRWSIWLEQDKEIPDNSTFIIRPISLDILKAFLAKKEYRLLYSAKRHNLVVEIPVGDDHETGIDEEAINKLRTFGIVKYVFKLPSERPK
jgi:hypothetical protein